MDYKQAADMELWQCCQQDDMRAYNELFSRYYPRMFHLASSYIDDMMKAEELCMDQLFNLWVKRRQINITSNFSHYLFRSIRNLVITHLRRNIPMDASLDKILEEHQLDRPTDYRLLSEEAEQAYRTSLNELSPQRRQVFILSREENLTYSEIAQRMNLSVNTVENYMVAALNSLRKNMKEYVPSAMIPLLFLRDFL
ncbi:RNA polymerase sigma-70 factor [Chitinophaga nivalis]|uniref:RNA polymerase sigma-70 factor n=1 Tax=Chitinophaga nivalis TaxID=2991709 RepID=A0ABT3IES6_9BACT|nr:RNA polymerase sigma-70 factor [Chitinophaga nivalis]MCW3467841.1 RNA polymerase sigma-70 factor [Chitinophaga nivalis]MCW3482467.1 RNA polymerase sigma-70 factor [Chitinophaga nivalis]